MEGLAPISGSSGRTSNPISPSAGPPDVLLWLGIPVGYLVGELPSRELAALCRRRLWPEARNIDPAVPDEVYGRFYSFGRPIGYLRQRTAELLHLAELAGEGVISWG